MLYAIIAVVVIIIDQWVKYWVAGAIPMDSLGETLIPGVVSLVNLHNDGAAFGFLSGGGARIYFIILTGVFTVAVILALATKFISGPVSRWSIVLVTAGGLSNCLDRVIYGYVQDMFKFELSFLDWFPIFNVADIVITVFCVVFILAMFLERVPQGDEEFAEDDEEEDRPSRRKARAEAEAEEAVPAAKPKRRRSKQEDEYEQYKAARAARQQAEAAAAPVPTPTPVASPAQKAQPADDPFAEWERANARAGVQPSYAAPVAPAVTPAAPAAEPVPAPAPAAAAPAAKPVKSADDFDLDDILNEFK